MKTPARAVVDIGSNSVKCLAAQGFGTNQQIIREISQVTRLGEKLEATGKIGAESAERNLAYLAKIRSACMELEVGKILCVGAETLRRAKDTESFAAQLKCRTGWQLRILTPEEEARLSFESASALAPASGPCLVIDSGGGSTEFSFGHDSRPQASLSLPLGALTLSGRFLPGDPPGPSELERLREHIQTLLAEYFPGPDKVIGIACGGGVSSMAAVALALQTFNADQVQGYFLSGAEIGRQIVRYSSLREAQRARIPGLQQGRAGTILASALILEGIARHFQLEGFQVSSRGLRHALLAEKYLGWFQPFI